MSGSKFHIFWQVNSCLLITLRISSDEHAGIVPVMFIGSNNVFEVDCVIESKKIGDNNIVESKGMIVYSLS